jgi:hypothetical protein
VTLTWTDKEGTSSSGKVVQNNLVLTVTAAVGRFSGDWFDLNTGESILYTRVPFPVDLTNNVQHVVFLPSTYGISTITVNVGPNTIAAKAIPNGPGTVNQDFALFVDNACDWGSWMLTYSEWTSRRLIRFTLALGAFIGSFPASVASVSLVTVVRATGFLGTVRLARLPLLTVPNQAGPEVRSSPTKVVVFLTDSELVLAAPAGTATDLSSRRDLGNGSRCLPRHSLRRCETRTIKPWRVGSAAVHW